jgi:hypothetical protein
MPGHPFLCVLVRANEEVSDRGKVLLQSATFTQHHIRHDEDGGDGTHAEHSPPDEMRISGSCIFLLHVLIRMK